jgi:hypothetical protein
MISKEELSAWPFPKQLATTVLGFNLDLSSQDTGTRTVLFTYELQERHRSFIAFYDDATNDFMVRIVVGLTEYNDVSYIVPDIVAFEKLLTERMTETLHQLAVFEAHHLESVCLHTNILAWEYGRALPKRIGIFELFISPDQPIKIINGSYVVIDYSCFAEETNLLIYYNIYRDEYFGEIRLRRTPEMIFNLDAKTLKQLQENLELHLQPLLAALESRLA